MIPEIDLPRFQEWPELRRREDPYERWCREGYDPADDMPLCGNTANDYDQIQARPDKEEYR